MIIQAGICEVVFLAAKDAARRPEYAASIRLLDAAGVHYRRFDRSAPAAAAAASAEVWLSPSCSGAPLPTLQCETRASGIGVGADGALAVVVDLGAIAARIGEPGGDAIGASACESPPQ